MSADGDTACLAEHHDFCESLSRAGVIFCRRCGAELTLGAETVPFIYLAQAGETE